MTIITDKVAVKNGADYTFVCGKVPFAITCAKDLHHGGYNFIDLDLVNKMRIPLKNIKVCRMTYQGENLRSVGHIDQTISCVHNGVIQGSVHLTAVVVRDLYNVINIDCVASAKTYEKLVGKVPAKPPEAQEDDDEDVQDHLGQDTLPQGNNTKKEDVADVKNYEAKEPEPPDAEEDPPTKAQACSFTISQPGPNLMSIELESDGETKDDDQPDEPTVPCLYKIGKIDLEIEEELICNRCFRGGISYKVASNHSEGCPTCPSMTPEEKVAIHGRYWKDQAKMIIQARYKAEKEGRRSSAHP